MFNVYRLYSAGGIHSCHKINNGEIISAYPILSQQFINKVMENMTLTGK